MKISDFEVLLPSACQLRKVCVFIFKYLHFIHLFSIRNDSFHVRILSGIQFDEKRKTCFLKQLTFSSLTSAHVHFTGRGFTGDTAFCGRRLARDPSRCHRRG